MAANLFSHGRHCMSVLQARPRRMKWLEIVVQLSVNVRKDTENLGIGPDTWMQGASDSGFQNNRRNLLDRCSSELWSPRWQ